MVAGTFDFYHIDDVYSIQYSYIPGDPGRLFGPWEDCYPPEDPEPEIEAVFDAEGRPAEVTGKLEDLILDAICEHAEQEIREAREEMEIARYERATI